MAQRTESTSTRKSSEMESMSIIRGPPQLPLSVQQNKKAIVIAWSILITLSFVLPNILWFSLYYGTNLSSAAVYSIPTALFGCASFPNLIKRWYRLWKRHDEYRPLHSGRWTFDFFMYNFLLGFFVITLMIALGIAFKSYKIVSLPFPYLLTITCPQLLGTWLAEKFTNVNYFCQISSMTKEKKLRSGVYTIVEDVCAVDGGCGKAYRAALDERYTASHEIRQLMSNCGLLWGLGGTIVGVSCIIVIALVHIRVVEWIVGWIVPPVFAAVFSVITIALTKRALRREEVSWLQQTA